MIEFAVINNGTSNRLPIRSSDPAVDLLAGDLDEGHAAAQTTLIDAVREGILAEELGYDYYMVTEHHFQPEGYEFSPNPLQLQTAIAARTQKIRLVQCANIVPWHHPIRLAEQAAMLDVISGGRCEFGIGRGYQSRETEVLGAQLGSSNQDQERNRAYFEEAYELIIKAWTEPSFSHHGTFFSVPPSYTKWNHPLTRTYFGDLGLRDPDRVVDPRNGVLKEITVLPHPVQQPHPQVWAPMASERSIRWLASKGINGYMAIEPDVKLKAAMETYIEACEAAGWPDRGGDGRPFALGWDGQRKRGIGFGRVMHLTDDKTYGDRARFLRGVEAEWTYYGRFGFAVALQGPDDPMPDLDARISAQELIDKGAVLVGTAEEIVESILRTRDFIGCDDILFMQRHDAPGLGLGLEVEQMHVFAEEVMPLLERECGGRREFPVSDVDLSIPADPEGPAGEHQPVGASV